MLILNAFSANMLGAFPCAVQFTEIPLDEARCLAVDNESAVGHADTAAVFADVLGVAVVTKRVTVSLAKGQTALVGQYRGPRLPEGATRLPDGATIQWLLATIS